MMKKIAAFLFAALMVVSLFAGCAAKDNGKFIVGLDDSFPPMGFRDENNEIVGVDIDLAKEVAKRLNMEFVAQPIDWDSKELELKNGNVSCIWNGMTITDERKEAMLISDPYMANNQIIVVAPGSDITSSADLAGKVVGLQKGSSAVAALDKTEVRAQIKEVVEYTDNVLALTDLKVGRTDAVVVDEVVGRYYVAKAADDYVVLEESLAPEEYGIGFDKGNTELCEKVKKALKEMKEDGTTAKISEKWFGKDIIMQ